MAKKKAAPRPPDEVERIEFVAPAGFTAQVDAEAAALGLTRSAYIRQAVSRAMQADRRQREGLAPAR
jgi:hypothetical protein